MSKFYCNIATGLIGVMLSCSSTRAEINLQIDAGILKNKDGTGFEPVGGLLQIIATRSGSAANFTNPVPGAFFTGTDNLIVQNFAMNNNFGTGEVGFTLTFNLENTTSPSLANRFDSNDPLLLRWWPNINFDSTTNAPSRLPTASDTYGQFRSDVGEGRGIAWFAPADGSALPVPTGLNFLTSETTDANNNPGIHDPSEGFAANPVPEPSTYALLGLGLGGLTLAAMQQRRRRQALGA